MSAIAIACVAAAVAVAACVCGWLIWLAARVLDAVSNWHRW